MAKHAVLPQTFRCSLTLPSDLALELSTVAKALGISQSSLVTHLLTSPLGRLAMYLSLASPVEVGGAEGAQRTLRLRGDSREQIRALIEQALSDAVSSPDRGSLV